MKYYYAKNDGVIQTGKKADAIFWDRQWDSHEIGHYRQSAVSPYVDLTRRFLPSSSLLLEGGCGAGGKVAALKDTGYEVIGVDYAIKTVKRLNDVRPDLDIRQGDVFRLDFPENYFDGYWSFGVIEHFWEGYELILDEARRVLKHEGYLFLTFPCMSKLRRIKAALGLYKKWNGQLIEPEGFYQFILSPRKVEEDLIGKGFNVVSSEVVNAASGFKQELGTVWRIMSLLSSAFGKENFLAGNFVERIAGRHFGHIALIAARLDKS